MSPPSPAICNLCTQQRAGKRAAEFAAARLESLKESYCTPTLSLALAGLWYLSPE